jgi:hypothetical protein
MASNGDEPSYAEHLVVDLHRELGELFTKELGVDFAVTSIQKSARLIRAKTGEKQHAGKQPSRASSDSRHPT